MKEKKAPCLKCEKRTATCHADCMEYSEWKQEHDRHQKELRELRDPEIKDYIRERHYV